MDNGRMAKKMEVDIRRRVRWLLVKGAHIALSHLGLK